MKTLKWSGRLLDCREGNQILPVGMRNETSEIVHRATDEHQHAHADRVNYRCEGDPGCDEPGVRLCPQDKHSANYNTQTHY